jgi:transcriptional regulator with XRE-family HTH domain
MSVTIPRNDRGSSVEAGVPVGPVAVQTEREPQTVSELIRFWRTHRRLTQMELALDANLSTKHLSFVETGRSRPSRQLLVHLAQHLDLPIVERNRLLLAGASLHRTWTSPTTARSCRPLRESLSRLHSRPWHSKLGRSEIRRWRDSLRNASAGRPGSAVAARRVSIGIRRRYRSWSRRRVR